MRLYGGLMTLFKIKTALILNLLCRWYITRVELMFLPYLPFPVIYPMRCEFYRFSILLTTPFSEYFQAANKQQKNLNKRFMSKYAYI